jgi:hypothetical protein
MQVLMLRGMTMKKLLGFTAALLVLGVTATLTLVNPIVSGLEYGVKKGWFKPPHKP